MNEQGISHHHVGIGQGHRGTDMVVIWIKLGGVGGTWYMSLLRVGKGTMHQPALRWILLQYYLCLI